MQRSKGEGSENMSCPYCENDKGNTYDWNEFGQFLIKCARCKTVFRPSKIKKGSSTMKNCSECYMDGNCIYQANNDMCPLGVAPKREAKP